jgi:hypothetical protein
MTSRHRLFAAFLVLSTLSALPSVAAWFSRPFQVTSHEFDFTLGFFAAPGELSPLPLVIAGFCVHIGLMLGLGWVYYRIVVEQAARDEPFGRADKKWLGLLVLPCLFYLPWLSPDVFFYFGTGWIQAAHGMNPYSQVIAQAPDFPGHPVYENIFRTWPYIITPYGPLFVYLMRWLAEAGAGDPRLCLLLLKALYLALHFANAWMAAAIGRELGMKARAVFLCFLLNPTFLVCYLGRGHNDILLVSCLLLGTLFFLRQRFVAAILVFAVGSGFKYVPVLMMPVFLAYYLKGDWKPAAVGRTMLLGALFGLCSFLPSLLYEDGPANFLRLLAGRDQLHVNFLYLLPKLYLEQKGGMDFQTFKMAMKGLFFLLYGGLGTWILARGKSFTRDEMFRALIVMLLLYFVVGSPEIHEWYVGWFAAFVFWINRRSYFRAGMALSCVIQALAILTGPRIVFSWLLGWVWIFAFLILLLYYLWRHSRAPHSSPLFAD